MTDNMDGERYNHGWPYAFHTLVLLMMLVFLVSIREDNKDLKAQVVQQSTRSIEQDNKIAHLEREIRLLQQDVDCLTNIIVKGDYAYDKN